MTRLIGHPTPRLEDPALLRGQAHFTDDLSPPGLLHAAYLRSPHAHALIRHIDTTAARSHPGIHAVHTLTDLRPHLSKTHLEVGLPSPSYRQDRNRPALADTETVHVGEPIAIIVADSRHLAEDAAALIEIDYDPLPPVADCRQALDPASPPVHQNAPHNLLAEFTLEYGDPTTAFRTAPHVFREHLWQHRGAGLSIECRGIVARPDPLEDRLTVWSSTQTPHAAHRLLCDMLGRDDHQIRVITPEVGGGFGPKLVFYQEEIVTALAALLLQRPVKWIEDRREHLTSSTQERDQYWDIEIALDAQARILAVRGSMIHDHGAYTARGINLPLESAHTVTLPYIIPAYSLAVQLALTNKVPVTPVRGAGQPQGAFAMERLMDRAARELGLDRAEIRRRNLVQPEQMPYAKPLKTRGGIPVTLDSGNYPKCQHDALTLAAWDTFPQRQQEARRQGRHIGIGLANFVKGTGRGPFEPVTVRIAPSGKIHVYTGAAAMGQGTRTMLAQIVAEQLGADPTNIHVTAGDTAGTSMGLGGFNSRQTVMAGTSAHLAALSVRDKALQIASAALEVSPNDLEIEGSEIRLKGVPQLKMTLAQAARAVCGIAGYQLPGGLQPGLEATEHPVMDAMPYANGTAVAEVEVDIETGAVTITRFVIAHDCGRIVNPMLTDGQIVGGAAHGIGNALFERMAYDDQAQPMTTTLAEYLIVTATEMPRIDIIHHESPSPLNPLGVKGVGECGTVPTAPAIISAIEDALSPFDVHLSQTPIAPHELIALIHPHLAPKPTH